MRRNRLIADLLHRAGYIERVGSGFSRMENALKENHNVPLEVSATNFFNIRFYPRLLPEEHLDLTPRQMRLHQLFSENRTFTKQQIASFLHPISYLRIAFCLFLGAFQDWLAYVGDYLKEEIMGGRNNLRTPQKTFIFSSLQRSGATEAIQKICKKSFIAIPNQLQDAN